MVGQRGLLAKRQQSLRSGNKSINHSFISGESEVDKHLKKLREHNNNIRKQRSKYHASYFERYPEKLEKMLEEEQERLK